jgi:hypothetical protein
VPEIASLHRGDASFEIVKLPVQFRNFRLVCLFAFRQQTEPNPDVIELIQESFETRVFRECAPLHGLTVDCSTRDWQSRSTEGVDRCLKVTARRRRNLGREAGHQPKPYS